MLCLGVQGVQLFATPWTAAHQALLSMGILQARTLEWVAMPFSRGSSQPRDRTQVYLHYRWILYYLNDQGSPRTRWVGNLPLLQGIFPTQESNQCLLHCRQILYQVSYQESPVRGYTPSKTYSFKNLHTNIHSSLSVLTRNWKQPQCPSTEL